MTQIPLDPEDDDRWRRWALECEREVLAMAVNPEFFKSAMRPGPFVRMTTKPAEPIVAASVAHDPDNFDTREGGARGGGMSSARLRELAPQVMTSTIAELPAPSTLTIELINDLVKKAKEVHRSGFFNWLPLRGERWEWRTEIDPVTAREIRDRMNADRQRVEDAKLAAAVEAAKRELGRRKPAPPIQHEASPQLKRAAMMGEPHLPGFDRR